jgi:hypothetical protein
MRNLATLAIIFLAITPVYGAPPSASTPLPPSATLFNGDYAFSTIGTTYSAPVSVPVDGAWLTGEGVWDNSAYPYWDCSHSYTGTLTPNGNDYAPLFIAGWQPDRICSMQFPVFGCLTCGVAWGGQKAFPGNYMTTDNTPGFMAAGSGTIALKSNNGGGQSDRLSFFRVEQVNRDAMVNMTIYQSLDEENPVPASATEIAQRYFIANSADRIPVVPVFHYGTDSSGSDRQYPAGPNISWSVTWDSGAVTTVEERIAPQGLHGHSILAVSIPALTTGTHTFTVKATLPSGKTYTSQALSVLVYAQNIYITVEGDFKPKAPVDQAPQFLPGSTISGANLDLRSSPQMVQLNILIGRGSSGTFSVKLTNLSRYPGMAMNYPVGATDSNPDMDFGNGLTELMNVPIPKGGAPKVVQLPLYIYDYAASATIEVTMPYRKTTFTTRRRVPLDVDNNSLPDRGWTAIGTVAVNSSGLTATGDIDVADGATGADAAVTGDGLSNFEEFRGFFVAGGYVRLNPREKEIFVDVDPEFLLSGVASPVPALLTLSPRVLYLEPTEVSGVEQPTRGLQRTQASVNFNRAGVPVAHTRQQRAVRLIYQSELPPYIHLAGANMDVPVWQVGILGVTLSDNVIDVDILNAPGNVPTLETPMQTQFSEVYERSFKNLAINTTFAYPEHYDGDGNVVPECTSQNQSNCDVWDRENNLILPQAIGNEYAILYTVPSPQNDFVEHYTVRTTRCSDDSVVLGGLTSLEMERLKGFLAAHEMGHAMRMDHLQNRLADCGDLMYDTMGPRETRRTMSNSIPQPAGFSANDRAMMRLWQDQ